MFRFTRSFIAGFTLCLFAQLAFGASVAEEEQKLTVLQQSLAAERAELSEMQTELETYPTKLTTTENDLASAEQELKTVNAEVAELQSKVKEEPTQQAERELTLKQHAARMSERRVRSETRMLERYSRYVDDLREDAGKAEQNIAQLQERIASQRQRVAEARSEASKPAAKVSQAPPRPAKTVDQPAPAPEAPQPAPAPQAEPVAANTEQENELPALSKEDFEALQLAKSTMARVEEVTAAGSNSRPRHSNLRLTGSSIADVAFTHLGANQYRAEVILPSGRQRFRIDSLNFRTDISPENAGETYVFIADASNGARLSASYFKKSLLDYLGTEPALASEEAFAEEASAEKEMDMQTVELPSGDRVELSEEDAYAVEIAREHSTVLEELAREEDAGSPPFSSLSLTGSNLTAVDFEYLGHSQYRAEVAVQSGRQSVSINRGSYRIDIPDADDGEVYLFFVDATRRNRLLLTYYKKSILDYL